MLAKLLLKRRTIKNVWNIIMIVTLYIELLVIFKNFRKQKIKNSNV
jgi:hypothetical protein